MWTAGASSLLEPAVFPFRFRFFHMTYPAQRADLQTCVYLWLMWAGRCPASYRRCLLMVYEEPLHQDSASGGGLEALWAGALA